MSFTDYAITLLKNNRKLRSGTRAKYFKQDITSCKSSQVFNETFAFDEKDDHHEAELRKQMSIYIQITVAVVTVLVGTYLIALYVEGDLHPFLHSIGLTK